MVFYLFQVICVSSVSAKCWCCTEEGQQICIEGSHEARLVSWLPKEGFSVDDIKKNFSNASVALGAALKNKVSDDFVVGLVDAL